MTPRGPLLKTIKRLVAPIRQLGRRFLLAEQTKYIGGHGCLHTGAWFVTWNQVEGDYLEFGVFRGESFVTAFHALAAARRDYATHGFESPEYRRWAGTCPRLFAFDSFQGLPPGSGERDADFFPGAYSCAEAEFTGNIASQGVDLERVVAVPGFYERSLNPELKRTHRLEKAALVMIDCDLYESTVPVLDFLTDLVGQGSILIFHDWFRFKGRPDCGEQRACREWLASNPHLELIEYWREGPQAVSFIVNVKSPPTERPGV